MKLWIAKDSVDYNIYKNEPIENIYYRSAQNGNKYFFNSIQSMCGAGFERTTGIRLKNGQFCQIEVKQVGDVYYFEDEK
jgi:hypothetical protein